MQTNTYPPGQPWPGFLKEKREARKTISKARREAIRDAHRARPRQPKPVKHIAEADLALPLRKRAPDLFTISTKGIGLPRGTYENNTKGHTPKKSHDLSRKQTVEAMRRRDRLCKHGERYAVAKKSWCELIAGAMRGHNETLTDVIRSNPDINCEGMVTPFDNGYCGTNGCAFLLWTERRVYFPVQYDGAEWVESVPRNPCDQVADHVGGG